MEFSEIIRSIRLELNLSQEGLARELHVGFGESLGEQPVKT